MARTGRPQIYSTDVVMKLAVVAVKNNITSFQGLHRYLRESPEVLKSCGLSSVPSRRTLGRRLQRALCPLMGKNGRPKKQKGVS